MHLASSLFFLAAALPFGSATGNNGKGKDNNGPNKGLDALAKKAGLKYFGAATDTPGFRERGGYEAVYPQYDAIMWGGEFGQTTPTNGQKVRQ
jgi:endo-1,4-beta-xylanase